MRVESLKKLIEKGETEQVEFKEEMGGFSVYLYKDVYTEETLRKMGLNERQVRAVLYVKAKGRSSSKEYQELTQVSRQMASIDLSELVKRGVFNRLGKAGRGSTYELTKLPKCEVTRDA
jgi:ATP-dependent DNA helicase RecG